MGLTASSTGRHAVDIGLSIVKETPEDRIVALAGNPNVGKSTVFNYLTGMNQHTGNWPGKTVTNAQGIHRMEGKNYIFIDLPGTYSLLAHSAEEEIARDFICSGQADAVAVVCDATCLERNLNLVLQTIEITSKVVVCVNLLDEAQKKKIQIDLRQLEKNLGVPVVGMTARNGKGVKQAVRALEKVVQAEPEPIKIRYTSLIEHAVSMIQPSVEQLECSVNSRWLSLRLLSGERDLFDSVIQTETAQWQTVEKALSASWEYLEQEGLEKEEIEDQIVSCIVTTAELVCADVVFSPGPNCNRRDRQLDCIFTNKWTGIPIMILLLLGIFWITIVGANLPSQLLSTGLFWVEDRLVNFFVWLGAPQWLYGVLVLGMYRVLAWVVSVMLPPMAIFFPLFTLLEDFGYLPRIAFNLDHAFKKACTCGKQALTTCMGFGCNAAGVVGCRIIDSPRERLIAMITNSFVPCNGRFPILISLISMFFVGAVAAPFQSLLSTAMLTAIIIFGIVMTLIVSRILSTTVLKGIPSSFTLELPPYRRPQIGKVIVRSLFDRTLFVLGRAAMVAAPAGILIWILANVQINDLSLLSYCTSFFDPFAKVIGLDGVILFAFVLGWPANEIVVPIIIMSYLATGNLMEMGSLMEMKELFVEHGWTWLTALNTMLFCLMHWPCSTTCLTIYKESKSIKWTLASMAIPTAAGISVCFISATLSRIFVPGI